MSMCMCVRVCLCVAVLTSMTLLLLLLLLLSLPSAAAVLLIALPWRRKWHFKILVCLLPALCTCTTPMHAQMFVSACVCVWVRACLMLPGEHAHTLTNRKTTCLLPIRNRSAQEKMPANPICLGLARWQRCHRMRAKCYTVATPAETLTPAAASPPST